MTSLQEDNDNLLIGFIFQVGFLLNLRKCILIFNFSFIACFMIQDHVSFYESIHHINLKSKVL